MLTMGLLLGLGYAVGTGLLSALTWPLALFCLAVVLILRPIAGGIAMIGARTPVSDRRAIAFFGVKGIGSLYYLAYALGHEQFPDSALLWPAVAFTILVSIVVHGVSATPIIHRIDQRMGRATPEPV